MLAFASLLFGCSVFHSPGEGLRGCLQDRIGPQARAPVRENVRIYAKKECRKEYQIECQNRLYAR